MSLPADLLRSFDETFVAEQETRSAAVRRMIEEVLREMKEREDVARWVASYRDHPPTQEESIVVLDFRDSPWE